MSFTSNVLARLANAKVRIGPGRLESKENPYACFFNYPIALGWNEHSDRHVSDMILDIIRPFGISTDDYSPVIHISAEYEKKAAEFLDEEKYDGRQLLIGIHAGAGKPQNRWSAKNFIELIRRIREAYDPFIYLTATNADRDIVEEISHACVNGVHINMNRLVPEVAALACRSHLFISNDTGLMHVAAATPVKQLSLFGPTNPRKWAPIGKDKRFLWKGEDISAISVDDAFREVQLLLSPL
jgi:ADP-heptose:LPS heptosyltransferase